MTLGRQIITHLDRAGLRPILACLASQYARQKTGLNVRIFYDNAWVRRVGDYYLADSMTFDWSAAQIAGWKENLGEVLDMYRDWWFYQSRPKYGGIVVDIGAGIGEDAIIFSEAVGHEGRVLSVEAHPNTFRLLETTCRYNQLDNTTLLNRALMDKAGTAFIENRLCYKGNTVVETGGSSSSHSVPACSLDELCAEHHIKHIDLLKMNIEGAERLAILGMQRMIHRTDSVCIACHDFLGAQSEFYRTKAVVVNFLRSNDFAVELREQHPDPWVRDHVYGMRKP